VTYQNFQRQEASRGLAATAELIVMVNLWFWR